jgi:hypothetical protein
MFEPEIFAQSRKFAMSESFVGDNFRSLQGANLGFKAELYPILHELEADFFAARLGTRGSVETSVTAPGIYSTDGEGSYDGGYGDRLFDKYLIGANLAAQVVKGAGAGISNILIFDHQNSFLVHRAAVVPQYGASPDSVKAKLMSQWTNVIAGRANADTRLFMDDDFIKVGLNVEGAMSMDRGYKYKNIGDPLIVIDTISTGIAVNAGLNARVALGEGEGDGNSIRFSADLIYNNAEFRNDAAQSPSFLQRAILNNENGLEGLGLMNPFDALYRSVYKYSPSQYFAGPKPQVKTAYTNAILTKEQIAVVNGITYGPSSDPRQAFQYPSIFQAALPGGMATADRIGPVIGLGGSFLDNGINVGAKIAMLQTYELYNEYKPKYNEIIGGASVDIAKFAPAVGPSLVIGGSFGMYNQKPFDNVDIANNLISLGLSYNFLPRFSLLAGYQLLSSSPPEETSVPDAGSGDYYRAKFDYAFSNMAFGLSYKVADGGHITFKLSMLTGKKEGAGTWYERDEINDTYSERAFSLVTDYTAVQPEVYLTVKF